MPNLFDLFLNSPVGWYLMEHVVLGVLTLILGFGLVLAFRAACFGYKDGYLKKRDLWSHLRWSAMVVLSWTMLALAAYWFTHFLGKHFLWSNWFHPHYTEENFLFEHFATLAAGMVGYVLPWWLFAICHRLTCYLKWNEDHDTCNFPKYALLFFPKNLEEMDRREYYRHQGW